VSDCLAADKVIYDHISLNESVPVLAETFFQFRPDLVQAGTLKIGSGAPLMFVVQYSCSFGIKCNKRDMFQRKKPAIKISGAMAEYIHCNGKLVK
jgi:hypothetical protein